MIRYTLVCNERHEFESWFTNSAAYDKQAKRKLIECPMCGSAKVEKAIMAPRLGRSEGPIDVPQPPPADDDTIVALVERLGQASPDAGASTGNENAVGMIAHGSRLHCIGQVTYNNCRNSCI